MGNISVSLKKKGGFSLAPPNLLPASEVSEVQQLKQKQGLKQISEEIGQLIKSFKSR